ncbi:ribulose-phosphate 3-epimerase [Candidatus Mycoplasma mahonii]|uniref:ribulose-phosphate 3-epimerase n=1 Tax=Candidatus Mycoplasma mahonii TaxID=3004105 RepID=UPI0026ED3126|nr:ribulose-phosphate 3-epimerase [Candidatus Mycoplasma mahonii]WKX02721.1 ribulose-phosphate 3-epimerase [Candidatus Mycoplasma mahonii]
MTKISASILFKDNQVDLINKLIGSGVKTIHYDLMDGHFVTGLSLPTKRIIELVKTTNKHIVDIHLMSNNAKENIEDIVEVANYITIHIEAFQNKQIINNLLKKYVEKNIGIALNPETKISKVFEFLPHISHVLVMSVVPGKGGQSFIETSLDKIKELRKEIQRQGLNVLIQVDGGITYETGPKAIKAGADSLVSGSFLIQHINDHDFFEKIVQKKN